MSQMSICLLIFLFMIIAFFFRKIPMSFTSMAVVLLLIITGCTEYKSALATFGNSTVVTMVSMFIVAAGLRRTQMVTHISKYLYKVTNGSYTKVLATYVILTCILGQFVPSLVALFALVCPLVQSMCDEMHISPSKMMFPIALATVSTSFIVEPIGPYAAWFVTQNGYLESYGWTSSSLNMWSETMVFLPVGIITILMAIFVVPKFLPDEPELPTTMMEQRNLAKQEPLGPVREFLGYGIFVAVIICLMLGLPAWKVTMMGAVAVVVSGILTEREAINSMSMDTVLLYVGVVVLGNALGETGAAELLGNWIASVLGRTTNGYVIGFAFFMVSYIMTSFLYNRAVSTVLIPITIITCASLGCDPRGPIILCALATMSSLITPLATAVVPMAMSAGGYSQKTIFKAGIIPGLVRGLVGTAIAMTMFPAF